MFLKSLKNFLLKRKLKNSLSNVKNNFSSEAITKVGILMDESYFTEREALINELVSQGIQKENISLLVYKDKVKKNDVFDYPVFTLKDINWDGSIQNSDVTDFNERHFDL